MVAPTLRSSGSSVTIPLGNEDNDDKKRHYTPHRKISCFGNGTLLIISLLFSLLTLMYVDKILTDEFVGPAELFIPSRRKPLMAHSDAPKQHSEHAFATLCVGDVIMDGVLTMFQSLRDVNSKADFVALTYDISNSNIERLHAFGIRTYPTSPIDIQHRYELGGNVESMARRDGILWSKLRVWQLEDYKKVVMLDADLFVLKNVDELFQMPEISACPMAERREKISFFRNGQYGMRVRNKVDKDSSATLSGWSGLNSGVTVLAPSNITFSRLLNELSIIPNRPCCPSQEFLYHFFEGRKKFYRLPSVYNLRLLRETHDLDLKSALRWAKIYHFVGTKPWKMQSKSFFYQSWKKAHDKAQKYLQDKSV